MHLNHGPCLRRLPRRLSTLQTDRQTKGISKLCLDVQRNACCPQSPARNLQSVCPAADCPHCKPLRCPSQAAGEVLENVGFIKPCTSKADQPTLVNGGLTSHCTCFRTPHFLLFPINNQHLTNRTNPSPKTSSLFS